MFSKEGVLPFVWQRRLVIFIWQRRLAAFIQQRRLVTCGSNSQSCEDELSSLAHSRRALWDSCFDSLLGNLGMAIFFSNVRQKRGDDKPFAKSDVKKLYKYLDQHKVKFINEINEQLIEGTRLTYTTASQCSMFIDAVVGKIALALA